MAYIVAMRDQDREQTPVGEYVVKEEVMWLWKTGTKQEAQAWIDDKEEREKMVYVLQGLSMFITNNRGRVI